MLPKLRGSLIGAGVDWITVTCREPESIEKAREIALSLADCELHADMIGHPWKASGYEGFKVGSVQYGERYDGSILRLGSVVAASHWMRVFDVADHVTRIDLQCTFRVEESPSRVVHRHYQEFLRHRRKFKRAAKVARVTSDDGGYTAYTGRKCSSRMGRIYNKEVESGLEQYRGCVRYEQQFNEARAGHISAVLRSTVRPASQIAGEVLRFFRARGASVDPLLAQVELPANAFDRSLPKRTSDIQRKCQWLSVAVRPTLKLLLDGGKLELLEQALDIKLDRFSSLETT